MRKSMLVEAVLILLLSGGHAMAQGSGSSRVAPPAAKQPDRGSSAVPTSPRPPTVTQFAASFWQYLNNPKKPYRQWGSSGKTLRQGGPQGSGGGASQAGKFHHEVGQTYLNDSANHNLQQLPMGSVLVREEYAADGKTPDFVTVMYRVKTADPKHGNWYWLMYQPNGNLATTGPEQGSRPIVGRVASCILCHQQAGGNDFVFLNDRPAPGAPQIHAHGSGSKVPPTNPAGSGARR